MNTDISCSAYMVSESHTVGSENSGIPETTWTVSAFFDLTRNFLVYSSARTGDQQHPVLFPFLTAKESRRPPRRLQVSDHDQSLAFRVGLRRDSSLRRRISQRHPSLNPAVKTPPAEAAAGWQGPTRMGGSSARADRAFQVAGVCRPPRSRRVDSDGAI